MASRHGGHDAARVEAAAEDAPTGTSAMKLLRTAVSRRSRQLLGHARLGAVGDPGHRPGPTRLDIQTAPAPASLCAGAASSRPGTSVSGSPTQKGVSSRPARGNSAAPAGTSGHAQQTLDLT